MITQHGGFTRLRTRSKAMQIDDAAVIGTHFI
jgi:hypothetical protein